MIHLFNTGDLKSFIRSHQVEVLVRLISFSINRLSMVYVLSILPTVQPVLYSRWFVRIGSIRMELKIIHSTVRIFSHSKIEINFICSSLDNWSFEIVLNWFYFDEQCWSSFTCRQRQCIHRSFSRTSSWSTWSYNRIEHVIRRCSAWYSNN